MWVSGWNAHVCGGVLLYGSRFWFRSCSIRTCGGSGVGVECDTELVGVVKVERIRKYSARVVSNGRVVES